MRFYFVLFILITSIFFACNNDLVKYSDIEHVEDIAFPLDTTSIYETKSLQLIERDGIEYFAALNKYNNSIYFYNMETLAYAYKWSFPSEGPSGIKSIFYFHYYNSDTIFLINRARSIYIVDTSLTVKKKIDALNLNYEQQLEPLSDILWTSTLSPLVYSYPEVKLNGIIFGSKRAKLQCSYDLEKEKFNLKINYPLNEYYTSKERLFSVFYTYSVTYNKNKDILAYSFPASEYVYIYAEQKDSFLLEPDEQISLNPYIERNNVVGDAYVNDEAEREYFGPILYDTYRKLYYRFYVLKNEDVGANLQERKENRNALLLVADADGNKLFESELSGEKYEFRQMFIGSKGLYICNKEKSMNTEDSVYYSLLKLK